MIANTEMFISLHKNDSYEDLILCRDKLFKEIKQFENTKFQGEDHTAGWFSEKNTYQSNLCSLAGICELISDRYCRKTVGDDKGEHWLFVIQEFLRSRGFVYDVSQTAEAELRKRGKKYSIEDHIRGMIYSLLSNQTKWHRISAHLPEIDELFFDYDPEDILATSPEYFSKGLLTIKCGNISTLKQMEALPDNIKMFRKIENDYGTMDAFVTSGEADAIVKKLASNSSVYKMKMMGEALVWEYLRNVGIDGAKPDVHLRRFLGADRMGNGTSSPASVKDVNRQVAELSEETGITKMEIDNLIWSFCADGYGEICCAEPKCYQCPVISYCKKAMLAK